jgi:hypothetical protein
VKKRAVVFVKGYVSLGLPWGYNYYAASVPHARGEHGFGMCDCNHRSIFPIERITYYQPATDTIMVKLPPLFRHYPTAEKVQPVSAHYHRSCDVMSGQTHQNAPKYIVTQGIHQENVGNKIRSSQARATMAGTHFSHGVVSSSNVMGSKSEMQLSQDFTLSRTAGSGNR